MPETPVPASETPASPSPLEEFLAEIARLTGLHVCLYDLNYFTEDSAKLNVPHQLRLHMSPFCRKIKSHPEAWGRCIDDQYERAELAAKSGQPLVHTCHAGLTDLVIPLQAGQRNIGALYLGQAVTQTRRRHEQTLQETAERYGFSLEELKQLSAAAPHLSAEKLRNYAPLLRLLKAYIEQAEELLAWELHAAMEAETVPPGKNIAIENVPVPGLDQLRPQTRPIREAVQLIRRGYSKDINLPTIARQVGLSESHFSRQFRQETGMTFRRCLLETRVSAAGYLLKKTNLGTKEIAALVGYKDPASFLRAFKAHTRYTPHEFLRRQPPPFPRDRAW